MPEAEFFVRYRRRFRVTTNSKQKEREIVEFQAYASRDNGERDESNDPIARPPNSHPLSGANLRGARSGARVLDIMDFFLVHGGPAREVDI